MIEEIKVSNFLSFKEEVTFSFKATKDTFAQDYQIVEIVPGVKLLRLAALFGYNASGKSNFLKVIDFIRDFVFDAEKDIDDKINVIPFKFDKETPNMPTKISISFYANNKRFLYKFEVDTFEVKKEKLCVYNTNQPTNLFNRTTKNGISNITFSTSLNLSKTQKEKIISECLKNISVFASRKKVNADMKDFDTARNWFKEYLNSVIEPKTPMFEYAEHQLAQNNELKQYLLDFAQTADFNITDMYLKKEDKEIPSELIDKLLTILPQNNEETEKIKKSRKIEQLELLFAHTIKNNEKQQTYQLSEDLQSTGTKRMIGVESAIFDIIHNQGVVCIDEIETSLHPLLIEKIIFEYLNNNNSKSQLIITTHYDGLLDLTDSLIRKDSVWFTDKIDNGSTDLYQLIDFKGVNRINSLRNAYRSGRFGAICKN